MKKEEELKKVLEEKDKGYKDQLDALQQRVRFEDTGVDWGLGGRGLTAGGRGLTSGGRGLTAVVVPRPQLARLESQGLEAGGGAGESDPGAAEGGRRSSQGSEDPAQTPDTPGNMLSSNVKLEGLTYASGKSFQFLPHQSVVCGLMRSVCQGTTVEMLPD